MLPSWGSGEPNALRGAFGGQITQAAPLALSQAGDALLRPLHQGDFVCSSFQEVPGAVKCPGAGERVSFWGRLQSPCPCCLSPQPSYLCPPPKASSLLGFPPLVRGWSSCLLALGSFVWLLGTFTPRLPLPALPMNPLPLPTLGAVPCSHQGTARGPRCCVTPVLLPRCCDARSARNGSSPSVASPRRGGCSPPSTRPLAAAVDLRCHGENLGAGDTWGTSALWKLQGAELCTGALSSGSAA